MKLGPILSMGRRKKDIGQVNTCWTRLQKRLYLLQALYSVYELLFMFDNATSNSVDAKDVLQVVEMNK